MVGAHRSMLWPRISWPRAPGEHVVDPGWGSSDNWCLQPQQLRDPQWRELWGHRGHGNVGVLRDACSSSSKGPEQAAVVVRSVVCTHSPSGSGCRPMRGGEHQDQQPGWHQLRTCVRLLGPLLVMCTHVAEERLDSGSQNL